MSAGHICSRVIATASPDDSIGAAARRMAEYDVGTLVVVADRHGRGLGIVTDRDIALRCVAQKLDPEETRVSDVMTTPLRSVDEHTEVDEAISHMASVATRRLVVTGQGGRVVGILSLDDVLDLLVEETRGIGRLLERQKPHIPA